LTTIQFEFGRSGAARRRETSTSRVLILGDFGARAHRGVVDPASLARRPVISVDIDSLDSAIERCSPTVAVNVGDGSTVQFAPTGIDDFHPDRLVSAHPRLASLMALRRRLLDPSQFAAAAAELGAARGGTPDEQEPEADQDTLGRLLGGSASKSAPRTNPSAASAVDAFLRRTVPVKHQARGLEFQPQYLAVVDEAATRQLSTLLHSRPVQTLEANWRSIEFLLSRLDVGEELELHLLDVTLDELRADAANSTGGEAGTALTRRLRALAEDAVDAEASWLLAGGLFSFGAGDLDVLAAVGEAARVAGMPFVASVDSTIAGTFPDASEWQRPDDSTLALWQEFRRRECAASIGLVCGRVLLRLPYGQATDAIDSFAFEELTGSPPPLAELLWGEGTLAAILVRARADEAGAFDIDELPALTYTDDGDRALQPAAEWLIGERVADQLTDFGLMPLLGSRHRNAVRLATWRNLALPR